MLRFVVDASVIVKWVLPGEPYEENAVRLKNDHASKLVELCAPSLTTFEVANTILRAIKLEKLTANEAELSMEALEKLRIVVYEAGWHEMLEVVEIARRSDTTVYDASYIRLARKLAAPLITPDGDLVGKAAREVKTLHLKDY